MDPIRLALLTGTVCLLGCGDADAGADRAGTAAVIPSDTTLSDGAADGDEVFTPDDARTTLPSDRIHYSLTDHEWYARGEPLVHDGLAWVPAGMPIAASASDMTPEGEYGGVSFYRRAGEETAALYVPVFRGWWQTFRPDSTRTVPAAPGSDAIATPR